MSASDSPISQPTPAGAGEAPHADPEFVAWASEHERQRRRHQADLAQITTHPDEHAAGDAIGQQQAWARRHEHERHLHDSAIAQIRPPATP
jgi:hypothetical protein